MSNNIYTTLCREIDDDFGILSEKSRDQLKGMIERAMRDAHARGMATPLIQERPVRSPLRPMRSSAS